MKVSEQLKHEARTVPFCPNCGAPECVDDPGGPNHDMLFVRGFKVDNHSQCLRCAGYYEFRGGHWRAAETGFDENGGWFDTPHPDYNAG
jgi:hypothetical protein